MKKILIPTDFSENAADALAYTLELTKGTNAQILVLNVIDPNVVPPDIPSVSSDILGHLIQHAKDSMKALEAFSKMSDAASGIPHFELITKIEVGVVSQQIKKVAEEYEADVIIMGTQGVKHNLLEKILGTVSMAVISDAPCPVLLVPFGYKYKSIDNLIFSTSLNHSYLYELWRATETIKPRIGTIRCVYVSSDVAIEENKELKEFAKYMVEHSPGIRTIFNVEKGNSIEEVLSNYADNYDAEMIVMHRTKRNIWQKLFGQSHTRNMISWINVPLMVMN